MSERPSGPSIDEAELWAKVIAGNALYLAKALIQTGTLILARHVETLEDGEKSCGLQWEPIKNTVHNH